MDLFREHYREYLASHPLKGGGAQKVVPCLEGGGAKSFGPVIFPFCSPFLPVINDQSLGVLLVIIGQLESRLFM